MVQMLHILLLSGFGFLSSVGNCYSARDRTTLKKFLSHPLSHSMTPTTVLAYQARQTHIHKLQCIKDTQRLKMENDFWRPLVKRFQLVSGAFSSFRILGENFRRFISFSCLFRKLVFFLRLAGSSEFSFSMSLLRPQNKDKKTDFDREEEKILNFEIDSKKAIIY